MSDGGFATIGGKVVPVGGGKTEGPKIHTGPRQGQFWHHPVSGNKNYGPVPLKHQKAVEAAGGPKASPAAHALPSAPAPAGAKGNHGSSAPSGHAPRPGHPHHPKMGEHGSTASKVSAELNKAGSPLGAVGALVHTAMSTTDPQKPSGHH